MHINNCIQATKNFSVKGEKVCEKYFLSSSEKLSVVHSFAIYVLKGGTQNFFSIIKKIPNVNKGFQLESKSPEFS